MLARLLRFLLPALVVLAAPAWADGWIDNVDGVTLDANGRVQRFTGLLITPDGRVSRLLGRGDKKPERADWRADGRGRTLLPGFVEGHAHVMELGVAALTLDLSKTRSLADAQAAIRAYAQANPGRKWILGSGWNQESWGLGRMPTTAELDAAVADRPVWLQRADGHAAWGNGAALRLAGVTAASKAPPGGRIDGGVFVDGAMKLVEPAVPPLTGKDRDVALLAAQAQFLSVGVTTAADMGSTIEDWMAFRRAGDGGRLQLRIISYARGLEPLLTVTAGEPTPWLYGDRLRMIGIKLFADGALGSRGACLKQPYADKPSERGACFYTDSQLRNLMSRAAMDGLQVAVHAIGDQANAQVLDAIEDLAQTYKGDRRWRVEHAQIVAPADLPRFGRNGVVASMQPVHQTSDWRMAEARLGPARLTGAYAWNTMLRNGAHLAFGTDAPVESPNPFPGLAAAVTRADGSGQPPGGWQPAERVGREQALAAYTTGAAYAGFADDRVGRLAPGYRADFVLVDRNPLEGPTSDIRTIKVLETWIGGVKVYDAARATAPTR